MAARVTLLFISITSVEYLYCDYDTGRVVVMVVVREDRVGGRREKKREGKERGLECGL